MEGRTPETEPHCSCKLGLSKWEVAEDDETSGAEGGNRVRLVSELHRGSEG